MTEYRILHVAETSRKNYQICALRRSDIQLIREWRNQQMNILRQAKAITESEQEIYYTEFVEPTFEQAEPPQILLSYLYLGDCIGYGGLTNIKWEHQRAEVSFLVNPKRITDFYEQDLDAFLKLLKQLSFRSLALHRLFTETYDIRPRHVAILEMNGFKLEGRLIDHVLIDGKYIDALIHGCVNDHG